MVAQLLDPRAEQVLAAVVNEYVTYAQPVGSETIVRRYRLNVSSATVRSVMAELEAAGYLFHPHTSAGRVPSARGYRYYLERLMQEPRLPLEEQYRILHQFHQVEMELTQWTRLAASLLVQALGTAALVTVPTAAGAQLKHFHVLSVSELWAWVVAVSQQGALSEHLATLEEPASQEDLNGLAARLNAELAGLTPADLASRVARYTGNGRVIAEALARGLQAEVRQLEEYTLKGLPDLLSKPEFADSDRRKRVLDVLGERSQLLALLPQWAGTEDVRVTIGDENSESLLRDLTVVQSSYGIPGEVEGIIALLGPTRLAYARAISHIRYLAGVMSELVRELYQ